MHFLQSYALKSWILSQILNDHVHHICSLLHWIGKFCPLWWCLSLYLMMMWSWLVQIWEELIMEIWKKLTITLVSRVHNEHAHLLCCLTHWKGEFLPLWCCLSLSLLMMLRLLVKICKELKRRYEKDDNRIDPPNVQWACSPFLQPFALKRQILPLFDVICLCHYWWHWDCCCGFAKR